MPSLNERLAAALVDLKVLQDAGRVGIRSKDLKRAAREVLVGQGFLQEVMKGWYVSSRPDARPGDTTTWFAAFWEFCRDYLNQRFGAEWVLTPEQSLLLLAGDTTVPRQLVVRAPGAKNRPTDLPHATGIYDLANALPDARDRINRRGLNLFDRDAALVSAGPAFFEQHPLEGRTVLATVPDASSLVRRLIAGGHATIAGRLAGAFRDIGRDRIADDIVAAMRAAGYDVRETNPFPDGGPRVPLSRDPSPYVQRFRLLWAMMRPRVIERLGLTQRQVKDVGAFLAQIDDIYVTDAYHSLSIEGYRVSADLIEKVRSGNWRPDLSATDREMENALAARGYWQCFRAVKQSAETVLRGANPGAVADRDHGGWYRELFAPKVAAGILTPENLAGYRTSQVYLQGSRHVPLNVDAVRDAMPVFFELLTQEDDPGVRVVLGHFFYVHIHPYMDGNGRTGRFLMNVMAVAAGVPWIVIPVQLRTGYMAALEAASVDHDIGPLTDFIGDLIGQTAPAPE